MFISFNIKNKVLLNFENIKITKLFKKLNYKYYDLFEIEFFIKKQIYRLCLFKTFKSIHNVFHVSLLKSHCKNFEKQFSNNDERKKAMKSEFFLNRIIYYDKFQYFVK